MKKCKCGSYAINPCNQEDTINDLCDICYWRAKSAATKEAVIAALRDEVSVEKAKRKHASNKYFDAKAKSMACARLNAVKTDKIVKLEAERDWLSTALAEGTNALREIAGRGTPAAAEAAVAAIHRINKIIEDAH